MTRIEISVAAYMLLTGCAVSHQPAASGLPPVSPAAVQVFMNREPERPYVSIGRFTIEDAGVRAGETQQRLLADARRSAAELGANAILVTPIPANLNRTRLAKGSESGGTVEHWSEGRAALDVVAVVWACGGGFSEGSGEAEQPRYGAALEDTERAGEYIAP